MGPLSLDLGPGIHGLLGPNGSGKTTLLKTLLGFLRPTAGAGYVLGFDIALQTLDVRRRVGYMPENDVFVPGLNAAQTVRLAAELCGLPPARAHEAASDALHAVGLGEEAFHAPNRLSTGQRQRMKLAAALVHAPQLLFLDEPTNGLDPAGRKRMLELVEEVARERQMSVVLSTHILPDVEAVCQSALVLRDGLLVAHEKVTGRANLATTAGARWFDVEVLGDSDAFVAACRKAKLAVREAHGKLQVAALQPTDLMTAANTAGAVLLRAVPSTDNATAAIMERLEAPVATTARRVA